MAAKQGAQPSKVQISRLAATRRLDGSQFELHVSGVGAGVASRTSQRHRRMAQRLPLTLLFAGAVAWRAGVAAPARPSLPHHQRRGSPLSFAVPPDGESDAFGQAPQAPQQQPPPFVSSDEDELAEEEEGGALPGSGPASPDEWGLVRRAALTVGMVVPALVLAASLQRAGERAISEADRRAIVEAIREDVAVLEGYAETAAAYRVRIGLCGRGRGELIS